MITYKKMIHSIIKLRYQLYMLGIISFSDRVAFNIKSNEQKDLVLNQLEVLYRIKIIQKHHHNLDENNVKYVISNPHMMNLRSNGNRYYLYFTLYNDVEIIYFIDKKIHPGYQRPRIILGRGLFDKALFKNTLLDGEMVKCKNNKWMFLINDIICYEGTHMYKKTLPERLKIIYHLLENQYTPDETIDVCSYKVKNYYIMCKESIDELLRISKELEYTCRGIYLWPYDMRQKPKLHNFDESTIVNVVRKTKDKTEFQTLNNTDDNLNKPVQPCNDGILHTIEATSCNEGERILYLIKTHEPDIYKIFETENILNTKSIGIALVQTLQVSKMLRNAFRDKNVATHIRFKCVYEDKFGKWKPLEQIIS